MGCDVYCFISEGHKKIIVYLVAGGRLERAPAEVRRWPAGRPARPAEGRAARNPTAGRREALRARRDNAARATRNARRDARRATVRRFGGRPRRALALRPVASAVALSGRGDARPQSVGRAVVAKARAPSRGRRNDTNVCELPAPTAEPPNQTARARGRSARSLALRPPARLLVALARTARLVSRL